MPHMRVAVNYRMNTGVLVEWLGQGGNPVDVTIAEWRANTCLSCPKHRGTKLWEQLVTHPVAMRIREHLEVKHGLNLSVPTDEHLGVCNACGCCVPLKIWTPLLHIQSETPDLTIYPETCWIRKESTA